MANNEYFNEEAYTCAGNLWPLGSILRITRIETGKSIDVKVTDRIGKRFTNTRVDLTPMAFSRIAELKTGIVAVKVEVIE